MNVIRIATMSVSHVTSFLWAACHIPFLKYDLEQVDMKMNIVLIFVLLLHVCRRCVRSQHKGRLAMSAKQQSAFVSGVSSEVKKQNALVPLMPVDLQACHLVPVQNAEPWALS